MMMIDTDKNGALARQWGVRGIPDMRFLDLDGKEAGKYKGRRSAESFVQQFNDYSSKLGKSSKGGDEKAALEWITKFDVALEEAKKDKKALFVLFDDGSETVQKLVSALGDDKLKKLYSKLVFAKIKFDKESDLAKATKAEGSDVRILDTFESDLAKSVAASKKGALSADELKALLEQYDEADYSCEKCGTKSFAPRKCHDAEMKKK